MYDDNYGYYEVDPGEDPADVRRFYDSVQRRSVWKDCDGCGRRVKILPEYGYCNSCAEARENGWAP